MTNARKARPDHTPTVVRLLSIALLIIATAGLPLQQPEKQEKTNSRSIEWSSRHTTQGSSIEEYDAPATDPYFRFTAVPQARSKTGTDRSENTATKDKSGAQEGLTSTYNWSTKIDRIEAITPGFGWLIFTQWHQELNRCPPNVAFRIIQSPIESNPTLQVETRGGDLNKDTCRSEDQSSTRLGEAITGRWFQLSVKIEWSAHRTKGKITVLLDGRQLIKLVNVATLYTGMDAYLKQGVYRSASQTTQSIDIGETRYCVEQDNP
ncbi:heparin lyase I family protein [Rhodococcus fascians]|nr:heparin lyase I family protein [Rhodococcus fascians]